MVCNGFVGELQGGGPLDGSFFQQKGCHPFVQTLPHDLFYEPHHIGKVSGHQLVGVIGHSGGFFHDTFIDLCGNDPKPGILLGFNGHFKLNGAQHTGGRKQTYIPVEQSVKGDFSAGVREDVGSELSGID